MGTWMIGFYFLLFILMLALYRLTPESRKRIGVTAFLTVCSAASLLVVKFLGGPASSGPGKIVDIVSRLFAVIAAINVVGETFFSLLLPKIGIRLPRFIEDLILVCSYLVSVIAVISASGANLSGILATSAVVTGVVAFSLQDTLGNIIGGMVLHIENSFMPGDMIRVESYEGIVREIRWRHTTLETLDGDLVIIPNITLMKASVTVMGRAMNNTRWREVLFNVDYDVKPGEVIEVVNRYLQEKLPENVASEPGPVCAIKNFQPNCIVYAVRYYITNLLTPFSTDSLVLLRVYYALSRAGIKMLVPVRSMVVSDIADAAVEKSIKTERRRRIEAIKGVDVFQSLTESEKAALADSLKLAPFSSGEILMKQGAVADWLYIIYKGSVEVRLYSVDEDGKYQVVKTLGPGDFLGEMGLLTGEQRSATAVAVTETGCYRLDREGFRDVLAARPEIAESIAGVLASRKVELLAAQEKMAGEKAVRLVVEQNNFLSRIRDFFSL